MTTPDMQHKAEQVRQLLHKIKHFPESAEDMAVKTEMLQYHSDPLLWNDETALMMGYGVQQFLKGYWAGYNLRGTQDDNIQSTH